MSSNDDYRLDISVTITRGNYSDRLAVNESFAVPAGTFLEVAQILGKFHELAESVKAEQR